MDNQKFIFCASSISLIREIIFCPSSRPQIVATVLLHPKHDTYLHQDADSTGHSNCTHTNHTDLIVGMTLLLFVNIVDELILDRHGALLQGKQQIISPGFGAFTNTRIFVSSKTDFIPG